MGATISEQWGDELQASLHVLVDVGGPALALVQASQQLDGGLQEHRSPGAAQGLSSQQVTGHAPHLQVTQRHLGEPTGWSITLCCVLRRNTAVSDTD